MRFLASVTVSGCDTSKPNKLDYTLCVLYKSSMYSSSSERLERPTSTELPEGILEGLLVYKNVKQQVYPVGGSTTLDYIDSRKEKGGWITDP